MFELKPKILLDIFSKLLNFCFAYRVEVQSSGLYFESTSSFLPRGSKREKREINEVYLFAIFYFILTSYDECYQYVSTCIYKPVIIKMV